MGHDFSWSVSRHDTFSWCRRKYFYSYYAAVDDLEIRRLKQLSALPLWVGSVVHETIETFLKERDQLPGEAEQAAMIEAAVHQRMLSDWRDSEANSVRFRLFEHEYEVPVEKQDKQLAVSTVRRSLRAFFRCRALAEALEVGRESWLSVEDLDSFDLDGTKVFLRMDLAYRASDQRVVIVDWKTGRGEGHFNHLQLAGYALYATAKGWVDQPEQITTELAYLAVPRFVRREVQTEQIQEARRFILKSSASMKTLLFDPEANLARLEDFEKVDRPSRCRRCSYRKLCFPREGVVSGRALSPASA